MCCAGIIMGPLLLLTFITLGCACCVCDYMQMACTSCFDYCNQFALFMANALSD